VSAHCIEAETSVRERRINWRRVTWIALIAGVVLTTLALLPGHVDDLREELRRIEAGDWRWLGVAAGLEAVSFAGYVVLFRAVFSDEQRTIGWGESYQITMAGVVATRLLAAAGAGGVALTAWALRRSGMESRTVARRMVAFLVLLYSVYVGAMLIGGLGLWLGVLHGPAPWSLTLVPAGLGALAIAVALGAAALPGDLGRRGHGRILAAVGKGLSTVAIGTRDALRTLRVQPAASLGAVVWWGFDIAVLWASFKAFGTPPPLAVIVLAYFVGTLGNLLPLPGGVGGVDGGIIAVLLGFGVGGGIAVLAVLTHRVFAFWLPTVPGGIAYLQLRRTVGRWQGEMA
jgi:putative heme transporter